MPVNDRLTDFAAVVALTASDAGLASRAVNAGFRLALVPEALTAKETATGELVVVPEDVVGADASVSIVCADRECIAPKARVFVDRPVEVLSARLGARACPCASAFTWMLPSRAGQESARPAGWPSSEPRETSS